jgi:hypothetical protein
MFSVRLVTAPKNLVEVWRARTNNIQRGGVFLRAGVLAGHFWPKMESFEMPSVGL